MSPKPGPKGGGVGRVWEFLFRAPCRIAGNRADHRALDAQIGQVAAVEAIEFTHGLAIDGAARHIDAQIGQQITECAVLCIAAWDVAVVQFDRSHFITLFSSSAVIVSVLVLVGAGR